MSSRMWLSTRSKLAMTLPRGIKPSLMLGDNMTVIATALIVINFGVFQSEFTLPRCNQCLCAEYSVLLEYMIHTLKHVSGDELGMSTYHCLLRNLQHILRLIYTTIGSLHCSKTKSAPSSSPPEQIAYLVGILRSCWSGLSEWRL